MEVVERYYPQEASSLGKVWHSAGHSPEELITTRTTPRSCLMQTDRGSEGRSLIGNPAH